MSAIRWFEIPVAEFDHARIYYKTVMDIQLFINDQRETMGSMLSVFPHEGGVGGCLVHNPQVGYSPSGDGTLDYLSVAGHMNDVVARVAEAGGEVLLTKTPAVASSPGFGIPKAIRWVSTLMSRV